MAGVDTSMNEAIISIENAQKQMRSMGNDFAQLCEHRLGAKMQEELTSFLGPATTYKNHVLPQSVAAMTAMKDVLEYYRDMSFEEWEECLDELREDAKKGRDIICEQEEVYQALLDELDKQMSNMKKRVEKMHREANEMRNEAKQVEAYAKQGRIEAKALGTAAVGVGVAAGVGIAAIAAGPATLIGAAGYGMLVGGGGVSSYIGLRMSGEAYFDAKNQEYLGRGTDALGRDYDALAHKMETGLLQRLTEFAGTMAVLTGFFTNLHTELESFKCAADKAGKARAHFIKIRNKATNLHGSASRFIAAVPAVQSQMQSIPANPKLDGVVIEILDRRARGAQITASWSIAA